MHTDRARSSSKRPDAKKGRSPLATCPVDGAGWCPYPFSPDELAKRLKQKAKLADEGKTKKRPTKPSARKATSGKVLVASAP